MVSWPLIGDAHKDHTEPSTAKNHGDKKDLEDSVIGFGDPSLLEVEFGLDTLEKEVYEKGVLEDWVNHGSDFSRGGVIPVGTDLDERSD